MPDHLIGLLLGAEQDWPQAFESDPRHGRARRARRREHTLSSERLTIEPFRLDDPVRTPLVIDRLAHWYYHPREWLKKAALVNGTYLLNSPFTFQSMEKHSAYCAMVRLGLQGAAHDAGARTRTRSTTCAGPTPPSATTSRSTSTRSPRSSATRST